MRKSFISDALSSPLRLLLEIMRAKSSIGFIVGCIEKTCGRNRASNEPEKAFRGPQLSPSS